MKPCATLAREANLSLDYVRTVNNQATGMALITVDSAGENMISVASGANAALGVEAVEEISESVWRETAVCLVCLESPLATVERALRSAREYGVLTILNPAPASSEAGSDELLKLVDVLTPNEGETRTLVGETGSDMSLVAVARDFAPARRRAGNRHVWRGRLPIGR